MHLNTVALAGKLSTDPELRVFDSGVTLLRLLVAVRTEEPKKRVDVIPVVWWEPTAEVLADLPHKEQPVRVSGAIHRRFWDSPDGRRSRLEVVASNVTFSDLEVEEESNDAGQKVNG